jgi:hypothetical protein
VVVGSWLSDSGETAVAALASGACGAWADGTRLGTVDGEEGGWHEARWVRERERKNKEAACDGEVLAFWSISLPAGVRAAATPGSEWKSRERSK